MFDFYKASLNTIDAATKRFKKNKFKLDDNRLHTFKMCCYALQGEADKMNVESVGFSVDDVRKSIKIIITSKDFVMYGDSNYLYEVMRRMKRVNMYASKNKKFVIELVFEGLWSR